MNKSYLVICIFGMVCASSAIGATLNVPSEYGTIQAAINAATDGDTVMVAAGTYIENLVWENKSITLIGAGADVTTINGNQSGSCLDMRYVPDTARVEGFTFTGGTGRPAGDERYGGGLYLINSSPALTSNTVVGNSAEHGAGLYLVHSSSPRLDDNIIRDNAALYLGGGLRVVYSSVTLTNNTITYNSGNHGGGLSAYESSLVLMDNTITSNSGRSYGGGLYGAHSVAKLTNNIVAANYGGYGGGLSLVSESSGTLTHNSIKDNSGYSGGGLYLSTSSPTMTNNVIEGNEATSCGGGLYLYRSSPTLTDNGITHNSVGSTGGGLYVFEFFGTLTNNTIADNSAVYAGGLYLQSCSPTLKNNTITGNTGSFGALWLLNSSPTLTNNTIAFNRVGGINNSPSYPGTPIITNCILWANGSCDLNGASATYSDIGTGEVSGEGNISTDPMFVEASAGDYHLQDGSPCIDAGSNSAPELPETDKDGNPRIVGAAVDMGAYECQQPSVITVEIDIKPGSYPNAINLGSYGLVPVAILSSADFDVRTVDPDTVALAGAGVAVRGKGSKSMAHEEDVNGDGRLDVLVQVETQNLEPESFQDGSAILTASTYDGQAIKGEDEIRIVPPE